MAWRAIRWRAQGLSGLPTWAGPSLSSSIRAWRRTLQSGRSEALGAWTHAPDADAVCRRLVREMGAAGWLAYAVPREGTGAEQLDLRSICILREIFAFHGGLAGFCLRDAGTRQRRHVRRREPGAEEALPAAVSRGEAIAAFALSEPDSGSDVGAIAATARRDGTHYVLDGVKTWISNGGIADFYVVFARTGEAPGTRGLSAFVVDADTAGPVRQGAHRDHRAASDGDAAPHGMPRPG